MDPVVITGGSRGVGRELALVLARRGLMPVLLARPSPELVETEARLGAEGFLFRVFPCDLAFPEQVARAGRQVLSELGAPLGIVHNAGVLERGEVTDLSEQSWERQLEVNLSAPFRLTRTLLPAMLGRGTGRILFISSISATVGTRAQAAYNASKAGQVGLMRCLAEELKDTGLMTAAVLPGSIDTDMLKGSTFPPRMSAADVAKSVAFFLLEAPLAHNGAVIDMFGV